MYIACPTCTTLYRINAEHLRLAEGRVRCKQCNAIFNANRWVTDSVQAALEMSANAPKVLVQTPVVYVIASDADAYAHPHSSEFSSLVSQENQEIPAGLFFENEAAGLSRTAWWSLAASLILTITLMAQYAWAERAMLANIPELRLSMEMLCQQFGCDLPLRSNPAAIEMVNREVRQHPQVDGALMISATIVNRDRYDQIWPLFQLSFTDVSGAMIAVRQFRPDEYLISQVDRSRGMQPGQNITLMLEVLDPGNKATSFQFDFL